MNKVKRPDVVIRNKSLKQRKSVSNAHKLNKYDYNKISIGMIGNDNGKYRKGIKQTELTKQKISNARIGKYCKENHPKWKGGLPKCIDCGKEVSNYHSTRCRKCYDIFYCGEKHHNYIHGEGNAPYPLEFSDILKDKIKTRDNYECQNCGMTEEEHLIVYGRIIQVHHIDYNKENCSEDNLITLCQGCNIRANYNRDYWQDFYKEKIKISSTLNKRIN
jgi:hypothetical protein